MNDGAVTPTPFVQSLGLGQLHCRLWSRDGSIHDGFMGLVSCLDQLGLQVLCVQETQSPLMSSLPMDQPFAVSVGSHGREAGSLFHSSIVASPTPDSQSLRWRLISARSLCVCSFYAPHAGIPSDTRTQFWRTLAASVHRVSQLHSGTPLLLAGDSNIWFPFFQHGGSRQADAPLFPVVQEILQSHSLVFRNSPDRPTHRCGAALDIILSSLSLSQPASLSTRVRIAAPLRLFVVPLLSSDHMLCSCRLNIPKAPLSPAHAQSSLSGGMMRATTLWLLVTAYGVTFVALGLLRIRLVSTSCVNSSTAQSVLPGRASGMSGLVL